MRGQEAQVANDGAQQHHVSLVEAWPRDLRRRGGWRRVLQMPALEQHEARLLGRRTHRLPHQRVAGSLEDDVELQRLRNLLAPLFQLVTYSEQLLRLEVKLQASHSGVVRWCGVVRYGAVWCGCGAVRCGAVLCVCLCVVRRDTGQALPAVRARRGSCWACAVCKVRRRAAAHPSISIASAHVCWQRHHTRVKDELHSLLHAISHHELEFLCIGETLAAGGRARARGPRARHS